MAGIIKSKPKMLPMVGGVVNGIVSKKRICLEFHNSMRNAKKVINKFRGSAIDNTSNHGNICELWPDDSGPYLYDQVYLCKLLRKEKWSHKCTYLLFAQSKQTRFDILIW